MGDKSDIVYLNVGGTKMATKRSTLCHIEGSLLASMFSGRWEGNVERDVDGHVFLDFNPKLFSVVLDYLRAKKIETPSKPALLPPVALEDTVNFRSLVDYLGVDTVDQQNNIQATASGTNIDEGIKHQFEFHSEGIVLQENETVALHKRDTDRHEFVIGKYNMKLDDPWRLCLKSVRVDSGVFVGVLDAGNRDSCISQSLTQRADNIFMSPSTWNSSYGWVLGDNSQMCIGGNLSPTPNYGTLGKQGDTIELRALISTTRPRYPQVQVSLLLRPSGLRLSINVNNGTTKTSKNWQCLIGLYHSGDCITLLS